MSYYLGIDTSNYTTSAAVFDSKACKIFHQKKLLPVKAGTLGLKQSDAVFAHVKQLPQIVEGLFLAIRQEAAESIHGVGVSARPRDVENSYMPCFLVGELAARTTAAVLGIPSYDFSHQNGHIAAALYSAGKLELIQQEFIAFHFSGGTTECVHVRPDKERVFQAEIVSQSLDLKCGQAIDRVGQLLGLSFPAGKELDALSLQSEKEFSIKTTFRGKDCCISGLENQCRKMLDSGEKRENIARYCIEYVCAVADKMAENAQKDFPGLEMVFSGGVMSNTIIREKLTTKYGCYFAQPEFSADNAAGTAILAAVKDGADVK